MTKITMLAGAMALGFVATALPATSQAPAATPALENVDWYEVQLIKWRPGTAERAHQIIDMFMKADAELGRTGVKDFHMRTGEWDSIVALPMRGGVAEIGWADNPAEKKWEETFARQMGGPEKAKKINEEFDSLILRSERHIGHIDKD